MEFTDFIAQNDDSGRRFDRVLKKILKNTNVNIFKSIRTGLIKLNGKKAEASKKIVCGDIITIASFLLLEQNKGDSSKTENSAKREYGFPFTIIFKNAHLLIINKPAGISVQKGGKGKMSLSEEVEKLYFAEINANGQNSPALSFVPGPLHRIDRFTSGLVAFSWDLEGALWFSEQMQNHQIKKEYLGIIKGNLNNSQIWKDEIAPSKQNHGDFHTMEVCKEKNADSKTAITEVFPLEHGVYKGEQITLARFSIPTGRKHQIRVQSAFHNFPLLFDSAYTKSDFLQKQFFLHAYKIIFPKNNLKLPNELIAPLPVAFKNFLLQSDMNFQLEKTT